MNISRSNKIKLYDVYKVLDRLLNSDDIFKAYQALLYEISILSCDKSEYITNCERVITQLEYEIETVKLNYKEKK